MRDNSPTAPPSSWHRYRNSRLAHSRELRELADAHRDAPRCSRCQIVLELRPDGPCAIAGCPLASRTSIAALIP